MIAPHRKNKNRPKTHDGRKLKRYKKWGRSRAVRLPFQLPVVGGPLREVGTELPGVRISRVHRHPVKMVIKVLLHRVSGKDRVMTPPTIDVGLYVPANPPLGLIRAYTLFARLIQLDSVVTEEHFQTFFPTAIWDEEFSWLAAQSPAPHDVFDYQTLLGYLASRAGRLRTGVVVTEPIRRHPVLIAQAMLTLSHMTKRTPILGIGAGERENTEPYGLDFSHPVGRLEEALKIIRICFSCQGPIDFEGEHLRLDGAVDRSQGSERQDPGGLDRRARAAHAAVDWRVRGRMVPQHDSFSRGVRGQAGDHPCRRPRGGARPASYHPVARAVRRRCAHRARGAGDARHEAGSLLWPAPSRRRLATSRVRTPLRGDLPRIRGL